MKTATSPVIAALDRIQASAKHMPVVRVVDLKVGEVARQGDIYVERVDRIESKGKAVISRQLAPGTTKGSRHIVTESDGVTLWESNPSLGAKARFQVGPAIEANGDVTISHPEHAWMKLLANGGKVARFYQVWFQADFARKERALD